MGEDHFIKQLKEAIRRRGELPFEDRLKPLIDRGIVDQDGRVLVRMPEPPRWDQAELPEPANTRRSRKKPASGSKAD
jgi:hypothetical protein